MASLDGLRNIGMELNPSHLGNWPYRIGQYMLNFGAIELISYQHLLLLEPDRSTFNLNLERLLGARISRIQALVESSARVQPEFKIDLTTLWEEARGLSIWRNRIAHNPALPSWKPGSNSERDPPDLLGVPDMRQLKEGSTSDSISLEGLIKLIDHSVAVAQKLHRASSVLRNAG